MLGDQREKWLAAAITALRCREASSHWEDSLHKV
jgi:hypothetical protein